MNILKLLVLVTLSIKVASAGDWSSGGGNALVCFDDPAIPTFLRENKSQILQEHIEHITSVETYDLYTAKLKKGRKRVRPQIAELKEDEDHLQYVDRIIHRLHISIPSYGKKLTDASENLPDDNISFEDHGVKKVDDINTVGEYDKVNCVLATMAVQYKTEGRYFLHIDDRLFSHENHSELSRGVLYLHEYSYQIERDLGKEDSRNTRLSMARIISNDADKDLEELIALLQDFNFIEKTDRRERIYLTYPFELLSYHGQRLRERATPYYISYSQSNQKYRELIAKARELARRYGPKEISSDIGETIGLFKNWKSKEGVPELLKELYAYHDARADYVTEELEIYHKDKVAPLIDRIPYLDDKQKEQLKEAFLGLIKRFDEVMRSTYSKEELHRLKNPGKNEMFFAKDFGVNVFDDLTTQSHEWGGPNWVKRMETVETWMKSNLDYVLANNGYKDSAVNFPQFE